MRKTTWRVTCPIHGAVARVETWIELAMRPDGFGPWLCPVRTGDPYGFGPCRLIVSVEIMRRRWWWPW